MYLFFWWEFRSEEKIVDWETIWRVMHVSPSCCDLPYGNFFNLSNANWISRQYWSPQLSPIGDFFAFLGDKMTVDCESHCQHCVVCNRAKSGRRGGDALQPLGVPKYPWEIVVIYYVTDLPKSGTYGYTHVLWWFVTSLKWPTSFHATRK